MVDAPTGTRAPCLDAEVLAAFIDGTLEPAARRDVIAHVGGCPECARLLAEVIAIDEDLAEAVTPAAVVAPLRNRGRIIAVMSTLAIAASILFVTLNRQSSLQSLAAIVGPERMTVARPTGGFQYGPLRSPTRGTSSERLDVVAEAARLAARAEATRSVGDTHAAGVAKMLAGETAAAAQLLASAASVNPEDASIRADLGAAQMTLFLESGQVADAAAALESLDGAIALAPSMTEAWFNKAVLLEQLTRSAEAEIAWTRYLALPDAQPWQEEARRSLDALRRARRER